MRPQKEDTKSPIEKTRDHCDPEFFPFELNEPMEGHKTEM